MASQGDAVVKASPDNPTTNKLPSGLSEEQIAEAVRQSGYPLQTVVAQQLLDNFRITEEWGFVDRETDEHRSLDIYAYRNLEDSGTEHLEPSLVLLVECKRADLPYIFFAAAIPRAPGDFPRVFGFKKEHFELHKQGSGYREVPPATFLRLHELPFVEQGPPISNAFTRSERKGKAVDLSGSVPFRNVILPLISALHHWQDLTKPVRQQDRYYPSLTLCICVLDAPMILASGTSKSPDLILSPWVRVFRQEAFRNHQWISYRHYAVDFVHQAFLSDFVQKHVLPFTNDFTKRLVEGKKMILAGKGRVADWDNWTWRDLQRVQ